MLLRAGDTVWWPFLGRDLQRTRESCQKCVEKAPSQPAAPPAPLPSPEYPFQMVSSDYFDYAGKSYLLVVDRYSNWPVVVKAKDGSSDELIRVLRNYFCVYGVPEELASDGAAVYTSSAMRQFLET